MRGLVPGREEKRPTDEISGARAKEKGTEEKKENMEMWDNAGTRQGVMRMVARIRKRVQATLDVAEKGGGRGRQQRRSSSSTARQAERY